MTVRIVTVITLIVFLVSCKKSKEEYPIEPVLEYKSFVAYNKYEAFMVLKFTDGDGDIGLKSSDTTGIYDKSTPYYYNLYIKTFYKATDGSFKDTAIYDLQTNTIDTGLIKQRVQFVEKTNKEDYLKGEFEISLNGYRQLTSHKVIKYKIYFYDRALHQSKVLETPELVVP
ncbi:MAG: hypothetical protein Q8M29_19040 [Bacteroidota bacterium]|nr:hypothetical protein [Bacteroidota bacterium]